MLFRSVQIGRCRPPPKFWPTLTLLAENSHDDQSGLGQGTAFARAARAPRNLAALHRDHHQRHQRQRPGHRQPQGRGEGLDQRVVGHQQAWMAKDEDRTAMPKAKLFRGV